MSRQRGLSILVVLGVILVASLIFLGRTGIRAAPDALSEATPIIQRPAVEPTPERSAPPVAPQVAGAQKVLFQDAFESSASDANWTAIDLEKPAAGEDPARWLTMDGMLRQAWTGDLQTPRPSPTIAVAGSADWTDYTLQASAYPEENIEMGVVFRRQDTSFYRVRLVNNVYDTKPKLVLEKVIKGQSTILASQDSPGYQTHQWYTFTVTVSGAHIVAKVSGMPSLIADDTSLSKGQIGVYGFAIGQLGFDNVSVVTP